MVRVFAVVVVLLASVTEARGRGGSVRVSAHVTKRGTYVPSHQRTAPDRYKSNNWSSKGNSNPYTGKRGSK